jgi:hypothetical protein
MAAARRRGPGDHLPRQDQHRAVAGGHRHRETDNDCVGYARECVRLAGLTTDPQLREQLLRMAREWMAMAMHESPNRGAPRNWTWLNKFKLKGWFGASPRAHRVQP